MVLPQSSAVHYWTHIGLAVGGLWDLLFLSDRDS